MKNVKHEHRKTPLQFALELLCEVEEVTLDGWSERVIQLLQQNFAGKISKDELAATYKEVREIVFPRFSPLLESLENNCGHTELRKLIEQEQTNMEQLCKKISDLFLSRENLNLAWQEAIQGKNIFEKKILEGKVEVEGLLEMLREDLEVEAEKVEEKMTQLKKTEAAIFQTTPDLKKHLDFLPKLLQKIFLLKETTTTNKAVDQFEKNIAHYLQNAEMSKDKFLETEKKLKKELFLVQLKQARLQGQIQSIDKIIEIWQKTTPDKLSTSSTDWLNEFTNIKELQKKILEMPDKTTLEEKLHQLEDEVARQKITDKKTTQETQSQFSLAEKALAILVAYGVTEGRGRRVSTIIDVAVKTGLISRSETGLLKKEIASACQGEKALFSEVIFQAKGGYIGVNIQPTAFGKILTHQLLKKIVTLEMQKEILRIKKEKNLRFTERRKKAAEKRE